ncbi:MAG: hypothetical protein LUM44_06320 [Pyrinomonadaceae bacterium]|nr:hypothetical protein [Pyrinomonadaceae bacterium]
MMNPKHKRKPAEIYLRAIISPAIVFFLLACPGYKNNCEKCPEICQSLLDTKFPAGSQKKPQNVSNNIVVYLDTSKSMRGYISPRRERNFAVSPNGQTVYSRTLIELKNAASLISPDYAVSLRRVAEHLSEPAGAMEIVTGALRRDEFYDGDDTDLALAVKSFPKKMKPDEAGPPRFHILVTDGVQSSGNCTQSSDPRCLKEEIFKMIGRKEENWGLTILGLRSEFDGLVYSEVLPDISTDYQSEKIVAGFRPFYLYIFSADQNELNQFTASLKERLLKFKPADAKDADFLREFPVTDNYGRYLNGNITAFGKPEEQTSVLAVTPDETGENPAFTVGVSTDTADSGAVPFSITTDLPWKTETELVGNKKELSEAIKWELHQCAEEPEGSRYPMARLGKIDYSDDGKTTINLETGWTKGEGNRGSRVFVLVGRVNTDKFSPNWVADWSTPTDTNSKEASKTLNLIESLGNLWKNAAIQKQVVAKIYLRVGER